jgi:hypothetical protein
VGHTTWALQLLLLLLLLSPLHSCRSQLAPGPGWGLKETQSSTRSPHSYCTHSSPGSTPAGSSCRGSVLTRLLLPRSHARPPAQQAEAPSGPLGQTHPLDCMRMEQLAPRASQQGPWAGAGLCLCLGQLCCREWGLMVGQIGGQMVGQMACPCPGPWAWPVSGHAPRSAQGQGGMGLANRHLGCSPAGYILLVVLGGLQGSI